MKEKTGSSCSKFHRSECLVVLVQSRRLRGARVTNPQRHNIGNCYAGENAIGLFVIHLGGRAIGGRGTAIARGDFG